MQSKSWSKEIFSLAVEVVWARRSRAHLLLYKTSRAGSSKFCKPSAEGPRASLGAKFLAESGGKAFFLCLCSKQQLVQLPGARKWLVHVLSERIISRGHGEREGIEWGSDWCRPSTTVHIKYRHHGRCTIMPIHALYMRTSRNICTHTNNCPLSVRD